MSEGDGVIKDKAVKEAAADIASKRSECVKVYVRCRPIFGKEITEGREVVVETNEDIGEIKIWNPKADESEPPKHFTFDGVYGMESKQEQVYDSCAYPIVDSVLKGFNGTIFCYGQTGAGKTHTMEGLSDPPEENGIMPRSFNDIFNRINSIEDPDSQFLVRTSYMEIYNEDIRDLLAQDPKNKKELKQSVDKGVYVKDLTSFVVKSAEDMQTVLQAGKKNRSTGATLMNQYSSRSHSIFSITVETSEKGADGKSHIRVGKLNMVDLAGSERQSKTGATGQRLKEATKINLSLSALGNVIKALVDGKSTHIPYRDSKLTRLLEDSLGGNTKTVMVANCGPADYNYEETLSTLRYADRAKQIKNKPKINEDPKDAMLREFQEEIQRLKEELKKKEEEAQQTQRVTIDGKEVDIPVAAEPDTVQQYVQQEGISEEKMKELQEQAEKEREELKRQAEEEKEQLLNEQAKTDEERKRLQEELQRKEQDHEAAEQQREELSKQLSQMQEKLLKGGEIMDEAAKQQEELKRAQVELDERKRQEAALARELEEKNLMIEDQYNSMAEEVEAKTKKLKKIWSKYQSARTEIKDLKSEFQKEREDMLDVIREMNKQLKLKQAILDSFVPPQEVEKLESRATWDEEADEWHISNIELAGNRVRPERPVATEGSKYPETEYSRNRRKYDENSRFKQENLTHLDLDLPERTTEDYVGADAHDRIALMGEEEEEQALNDPYLRYNEEETGQGGDKEKRKKSKKSKKKKSPREEEEVYPQARGLVR